MRKPPAAPSKPDVETPDEEKPPAVPRRQNTPPPGASPGGGGGDDDDGGGDDSGGGGDNSGDGSQKYVDMSDDYFSTTSELTQLDFLRQEKKLQELEIANGLLREQLRQQAEQQRQQEQDTRETNARLDFFSTFTWSPDFSSRSPTEVYTTIQK